MILNYAVMYQQNRDHITLSFTETVQSCSNKGGLCGEREKSSWPAALKSTTRLFADCLIYRMINSEEDWRTLEQDLVWTYTEIGRSMANAIQPGQMRCFTDNNKNSIAVQVCHSRTGIEERQLRQVSWWTLIKHSAGTTTSRKWRRRQTTATPYPSQTETSAVSQQTSRHNAIPNLQDHPWNTHYSLEPSKERDIS